jgi:hypothetical protein
LAQGFLACALLARGILPGLGLLALGAGVALLLLSLGVLPCFGLLAKGALACALLVLGFGPLLLLLTLGLLGLLLARGILLGLLATLVGLGLVFVLLLLVVAIAVATTAILRGGHRTHAEGEGGAKRNGPECLLARGEFHVGFLAWTTNDVVGLCLVID